MKEDSKNYVKFCKYELIKFCPYVDNIEDAYDGLTEDDNSSNL